MKDFTAKNLEKWELDKAKAIEATRTARPIPGTPASLLPSSLSQPNLNIESKVLDGHISILTFIKSSSLPLQIISQLRNIEDIEEQMDELVQILELTQEDFDERAKIAQHIQNAVSDLYPNCVVYLFGSTVNGLGFKGCDIDAFVDLGKN